MMMETVNAEGVAQLLQCHVNTSRRLLADGKIPAARVGRAWVVRRADVLSYLDAAITRQHGALLVAQGAEFQAVKRPRGRPRKMH